MDEVVDGANGCGCADRRGGRGRGWARHHEERVRVAAMWWKGGGNGDRSTLTLGHDGNTQEMPLERGGTVRDSLLLK